jgi:hypothetical protein
MNIEQQLDLRARVSTAGVDEYRLNPELINDDALAFHAAIRTNAAANWAVGKKLESTYSVAKKIIDSI